MEVKLSLTILEELIDGSAKIQLQMQGNLSLTLQYHLPKQNYVLVGLWISNRSYG